MKQKKEHSFAQRMMDYAEKSSREALEREYEAFNNLERVYNERVDLFTRLRQPRLSRVIKCHARKITKTKIAQEACAVGTVDGYIGCFDVKAFENDAEHGAEHTYECNDNKVFGVAVQNIFYDRKFMFLSRDGKVHASSIVHDMSVFVQQSDYHNGLGLLMCTNEDNDVFALDLQALRPVFRNKIAACTSLKIHSDGNVFVYSSGTACFVDIRSMKTVVRLGKNVVSSVFLSDHVICTSSANLIQAFDLRNLNCVGNILAHASTVRFLETSCETLYSGTLDGEFCVSSPALSTIHSECNVTSMECISADGPRVLFGTSDNTLRLVDF